MSGSSSISYRWFDEQVQSDVEFLPANEYVQVRLHSYYIHILCLIPSLLYSLFLPFSLPLSPYLLQCLTDWINRQLQSVDAFPPTGRYGKLASQTVKAMLKRLIRVMSHIFYCHSLDLARAAVTNQARKGRDVPSIVSTESKDLGSLRNVSPSRVRSRPKISLNADESLALPRNKFHRGPSPVSGSPPSPQISSPRSPRQSSPRPAKGSLTSQSESHGMPRLFEASGSLEISPPSRSLVDRNQSPPGMSKKSHFNSAGPIVGQTPRTILGAQRESGSRDTFSQLEKDINAASSELPVENERSISPIVILTAPSKAPRSKVCPFLMISFSFSHASFPNPFCICRKHLLTPTVTPYHPAGAVSPSSQCPMRITSPHRTAESAAPHVSWSVPSTCQRVSIP